MQSIPCYPGDNNGEGGMDGRCLVSPENVPSWCPNYDTAQTADNASGPITVTGFSSSGANQDRIRNVLAGIKAGLSGDCAQWLGGGADLIAALVSNNSFGHGVFNQAGTAAFAGSRNLDGSPTGVPVGSAFTVNDNGAFFSAAFTVGARSYQGGSPQAQGAILIHELAHILQAAGLGAGGFLSDAGNSAAVKHNEKLVDDHCRTVIQGLK